MPTLTPPPNQTTTVRKLLPESWGFLCPVHTPDGSPCGLLNHLARECCIMAYPSHMLMPTTPLGSVSVTAPLLPWSGVVQLLASLGMMVSGMGMADGQGIATDDFLAVLLDGVVVGAVRSALAAGLVQQLRALKAAQTMLSLPPHAGTLDPTLEIAHLPLLPDQRRGAAYPGIYLHTQPGRMLRPVLHLGVRRVEWIGPMEQVHMDIACLREDCRAETTHMELSPDAMLSHIAALTPFSDYNQSPRNMYQCQMGKQSMGTPAHAVKRRTDNKLFRLQSPQSPIVQTQAYRDYGMDEYPQGMNAVVAVVAYTGYDMVRRPALAPNPCTHLNAPLIVPTLTLTLTITPKQTDPHPNPSPKHTGGRDDHLQVFLRARLRQRLRGEDQGH